MLRRPLRKTCWAKTIQHAKKMFTKQHHAHRPINIKPEPNWTSKVQSLLPSSQESSQEPSQESSQVGQVKQIWCKLYGNFSQMKTGGFKTYKANILQTETYLHVLIERKEARDPFQQLLDPEIVRLCNQALLHAMISVMQGLLALIHDCHGHSQVDVLRRNHEKPSVTHCSLHGMKWGNNF